MYYSFKLGLRVCSTSKGKTFDIKPSSEFVFLTFFYLSILFTELTLFVTLKWLQAYQLSQSKQISQWTRVVIQGNMIFPHSVKLYVRVGLEYILAFECNKHWNLLKYQLHFIGMGKEAIGKGSNSPASSMLEWANSISRTNIEE